MKRSSSTPNLEKINFKAKKLKPNEEQSTPNTQEYLQLVLTRIVDLQSQINEGIYVSDDETSDLGESDTDEDLIMKEVLSKVFKNLPGSPKSIATIIDSTSKPSFTQLKTIHSKRIQLTGFEVCRNIAINFLENIDHLTSSESSAGEVQKNCNINLMEIETKKRLLGSLNLHLANKQRDYTARLMNE